MGRVAELVIGWSDLVEQEDLASSPGAGRDRERAVLGIGELVDPRATSVKDGRWSLNAEIGDEEGTGVVSVGESPIVFERDSRDAGEVAHREVTVQGDVRAADGRAGVLVDDEILIVIVFSCKVVPRFRPAAAATRPAAIAKARRAPATLRPPFCFFGSSSCGIVS